MGVLGRLHLSMCSFRMSSYWKGVRHRGQFCLVNEHRHLYKTENKDHDEHTAMISKYKGIGRTCNRKRARRLWHEGRWCRHSLPDRHRTLSWDGGRSWSTAETYSGRGGTPWDLS